MTQVSITIQAGRSGDPEVHMTGCQHLDRLPARPGEAWGTPVASTGKSLVAAIRAADADLADMFGQVAYDPAPPESPWSVGGITWAPCFAKAVNADGIDFIAQRGDEYTHPASIPVQR